MKARPLTGAVLAVALLAAMKPAQVRGQPLTEAEVVAAALDLSPTLAAAQATSEAAEAQANRDRLARVPELALSARYTRLSSLPERYRRLSFGDGVDPLVLPQQLDNAQGRLTLSLPITDLLLRGSAVVAASGRSAEAARAQVEGTRARVAFEVRSALIAHDAACASRTIARQLEQAQAHQTGDVAARVEAGTSPAAELAPLVLAQEAALGQLLSEESRLEGSAAELRALLPPQLATRVVCSDSARLELESVLARVRQVRLKVRRESPDVAAAKLSAAAQADRATAEAMAIVPSLSVVVGAEFSAPNPRAFAVSTFELVPAWDASLQLEWSFNRLLNGLTAVRQADADARALQAITDDTTRRIETSLAVTEARVRRLEARLTSVAHRVTAAETVLTARRDELAAGVAIATEVTHAEAEVARARLDLVSSGAEALLDLARLDLLRGIADHP